jgi:radical SAM superfamily enzyme YgiQ (UPF0313 family)
MPVDKSRAPLYIALIVFAMLSFVLAVTTYLFFQSMDWIKAIRTQVDVPVIVGGVHLSIYPRETLGYPELDFAVTGEAERALPDLLDALVRGKDLSQVRGIAFKREDGGVVVTPTAKAALPPSV